MTRGDNGGCARGCLWGFLGFILIALLSTVLACAGSTADSHSNSDAQQQTDTSISASDSGTEAESKQKDPGQTDATASTAAQAAKPSASDAAKGQKLVVRFLDVGQGDAAVIEFPDGKTMVIDAGREGGSTVDSALAADGRSRIDWLVATHPDADHIGGLPTVIASEDVGSVWAPNCNHSTETYTRFLEAVAAKGLQIDEAAAGKQIAAQDGYRIDVLWPQAGASYGDTNGYSVVILVTYGQNTLLFTGDAPAEALEQCSVGHVDVLKASHHGSASGTNAAVAQKLTPKVAILSYGLDNSYGHPAQTVMDALSAAGAAIYGTGAQGTITVTSDGTDVSVTTARQGTVVAQSENAGAGEATLSGGHGSSSGSSQGGAQAASPQAQPSGGSTAGQDQTVYVTPTGKKYHAQGCRTLSRSKNLTSMTKSQAEAEGYTACQVCGG
ncbi:MAG: ComEC/Rec2 family competence protein [Parafannyhessea sp.]|uniref:ComEC/Rec2 family competence protein n=1 Tax=Parafannyhessea sp. TaxID=2847324 RepID=UPI003F11B061